MFHTKHIKYIIFLLLPFIMFYSPIAFATSVDGEVVFDDNQDDGQVIFIDEKTQGNKDIAPNLKKEKNKTKSKNDIETEEIEESKENINESYLPEDKMDDMALYYMDNDKILAELSKINLKPTLKEFIPVQTHAKKIKELSNEKVKLHFDYKPILYYVLFIATLFFIYCLTGLLREWRQVKQLGLLKNESLPSIHKK